MEQGYLQSNGTRMIWDTKEHPLVLHPTKEGVIVAKGPVIQGFTAHCCKACKTITFSYE